MVQNAVFVFIAVIGSVFLLALISNLIRGSSKAWKELAERYPAQGVAEFVEKRTANIFLSRTDDPEGVLKPRGCLFVGFAWFAGNRNAQNVRVSIDDYFLHMDLDSGAGGPKKPMSLPWGAVQIGQSVDSHIGEHAVLTIDEFTLLVPTASIERELLMRQALDEELGDDPFAQDDPYAT